MADEGTECTDAEMNTPAYVRNEEVDEESSHLLSWDEWLREHASQLLLFARQQSRSPEDAEDILQDALVRLARKEASGDLWVGRRRGFPMSLPPSGVWRWIMAANPTAARKGRMKPAPLNGTKMFIRTPGFPVLRQMRNSNSSWKCSSGSSLPNSPRSLS